MATIGWLVLQRSGLSRSSLKTVLGCTDNTLDRSSIVGALKQQWPDHELLVYVGDRKRMLPSETTTESVWNVNEPMGACEPTSCNETSARNAENHVFSGSFADEDEEDIFNLARAQLKEALAAERSARRAVAQERTIKHDIKSSRGGYDP